MSGLRLLGPMLVVKPAASPHWLKPRKSRMVEPMMSSETASVFEVPSVTPAMPTRFRVVRPGA
ncbi:MAG: hypothetical protein WKF75_07360 [Singulisphaera sp.]